MELLEVGTKAVFSIDNIDYDLLNCLLTHIDILNIIFFLSF